MVEKVIKIVADTKEASKEISDLFSQMVQQEKEAQKQSKLTQDAVDDIGKVSKQTQKEVSGISKGFKGLGLAMKAAGIGLIIGALAAMKDIFSQNQRVVDIMSTAFETMSIVVNQVVDALFNVYDAVSNNSENFNGLGKVLGGLLTLYLSPLKAMFYGIKLAIAEAQLLWEKSFFGGKDGEKIAELTLSILETKKAINEVGADALQAGKDIVNNFSDAVGEVTNISKLAGEELSKVSIKSAFEQAKTNVQLQNTAQLAAAQQGRLVEQYDRVAEKLRQIRDADLNNIDDRIKANEELGKVLDKQEKAMIAQADLQIAAAQANVKTNNTIENQVALTEALANREGVLAQIEGFRSEQLTNKNSLLREQYNLNLSIAKTEDEMRLAQLQFEESQAETEAGKLEKQRERLQLENELILEDLEAKRLIYEQGTQARIDAENEYKLRKQEIDNELLANTKNIAKEEERIDKEKADKEKLIAKSVKDAKVMLAGQTLDLLANFAEEGSGLAKGVAVAQATMDTYKGATAAYSSLAGIPIVGPALGAAAAGLAVVNGLANVKKILSTKPIETNAPSSAGGGSAVPQAPSFNLVEGSGSNQIAESLGGQNQPLKAYVVSSDVTTSQSLDRNIVESSSF